MCINLEQEKAIFLLDGKLLAQNQHIQRLEEMIQTSEVEKIRLQREIEALRGEIEDFRKSLREELLEIMYPSYIHES
jgi:predicted  nucleic acid-binding Zn-ribbon protein